MVVRGRVVMLFACEITVKRFPRANQRVEIRLSLSPRPAVSTRFPSVALCQNNRSLIGHTECTTRAPGKLSRAIVGLDQVASTARECSPRSAFESLQRDISVVK